MHQLYSEEGSHLLPENKKIFFAVLNWGLGHATRVVPLIRELIIRNNTLYIGSDGDAESFLMHSFPTLHFITLPSYNIRYPYQSAFANGFTQFYKGAFAYYKEKKALRLFLKKVPVDLIISDNRFGCFLEKIPSVFITHQLSLFHSNRMVRYILSLAMAKLINHFHFVWIPDFEEQDRRLSGMLSENRHVVIPITYIGPLSRFTRAFRPFNKVKDSILVLLSGPEPQRSILEGSLLQKLGKLKDKKVVFVRGKITPDQPVLTLVPNNVKLVHFMTGEDLIRELCTAETIITRSGYSTIMDLNALGLKSILIPTPGQPEQEYLALHMFDHYNWPYFNQSSIMSMPF